MVEPIPLILYGDSLLIDGIEINLRRDTRYQISRLYFKSPADLEQLENLERGILVYDRSFTDTRTIQMFLNDQSDFTAVSLCAEETNVQICTKEGQKDYIVREITELSNILAELGKKFLKKSPSAGKI